MTIGGQSSFYIQAIKLFSQLLVGANTQVNHLSMSRLSLKFKIFSELLVVTMGGGVSHLSMSRLNLKFNIFGELLVGNNGQ